MVPFNGSSPLDYGGEQLAAAAILLLLMAFAFLVSCLVGR